MHNKIFSIVNKIVSLLNSKKITMVQSIDLINSIKPFHISRNNNESLKLLKLADKIINQIENIEYGDINKIPNLIDQLAFFVSSHDMEYEKNKKSDINDIQIIDINDRMNIEKNSETSNFINELIKRKSISKRPEYVSEKLPSFTLSALTKYKLENNQFP